MGWVIFNILGALLAIFNGFWNITEGAIGVGVFCFVMVLIHTYLAIYFWREACND